MYRLFAILACLLWGSAFVGAKIGFEYMEPLRLSGCRFALAGMLLWPLIAAMKVDVRAHLRHWRFMLLFAFLQTFMQYGLFFCGLNLVPAPTAAVIVGAGPLFVAVMAHYTMPGDKLSLRKLIAIALGLLGVAVISFAKGSVGEVSSGFYWGVLLLIVSNTVGASTNILVARHRGNLSPVLLTSFANFTGGVMLYVVSLFVESDLHRGYPLEFWGALVWLAIIPAAGFSIWYTLLQRPGMKVSELNMWKFIIPVTGCVLSWLMLPDAKPDLPSVAGIVIITAALLILQKPAKR